MNEDPEFERRARADLKRMVNETSPEVRRRLDEMAAGVARAAPRRKTLRGWQVALPVGGGVLAAALAAVFLRPPDAPAGKTAANPAGKGEDLALLLNVDNLDLLEQMEFYQWLDREPGLLDAETTAPTDSQRS
jgi:hypothetical protein